METTAMKKYAAECLGTAVLTLLGCGSAAIAGDVLGNFGIGMCFGLSVVAMAFAIGDISGCHINPAISLGCFIDGRISGKDLAGYIVAQFIGGIIGAALLACFISCTDYYVFETGLGCNG